MTDKELPLGNKKELTLKYRADIEGLRAFVVGRVILLHNIPAKALVLSTMREDQRREFLAHNECNFALTAGELGRFRASAELIERFGAGVPGGKS